MAAGKIKVGKLVWITKIPLALWMKPANSAGLWKLGIVVDKNDNGYCSVYSAGDINVCHQSHLKLMQKPDIVHLG